MKSPLVRNFIIMIISFFVNNLVLSFLPYSFTKNSLMIIPDIGLIVFCLLLYSFKDSYERFFFSIICGVYYAIVYGNSLMIYALLYLLIAFYKTYVKGNTRLNIIEFIKLIVLCISFKEILLFLLMKITLNTYVSIFSFILLRFIPSLIFNFVMSFIVYAILINFIDNMNQKYRRL